MQRLTRRLCHRDPMNSPKKVTWEEQVEEGFGMHASWARYHERIDMRSKFFRTRPHGFKQIPVFKLP